jgi:hypothetical protein
MKKIPYLLLFLLISSCSVLKNYDTTGFSTNGNTVLYNGKVMAELRGVEIAYDNKKLVRELTFELKDGSENDKIVNLLAFLNSRYKDYEIEIEIPIEKYKFEE